MTTNTTSLILKTDSFNPDLASISQADTHSELFQMIFEIALNDEANAKREDASSISLVCRGWYKSLQELMPRIVQNRWPDLFQKVERYSPNWISIYIHKIKIEQNVISGRFQFSEFFIPQNPLESSYNPFYPLRGRFTALLRKTRGPVPAGPHLFRKQLDIIGPTGKTTKIIEINHKYALDDHTLYLDKGHSIVAYDIHTGDVVDEYKGFEGKVKGLKIKGIYLEARTLKSGFEIKDNQTSFEKERYFMWDVTTGRLLAKDCEKSQLPPPDRLPDNFGWRFFDQQFEHRGLSFSRHDSIWTIQREGQPFAEEIISNHERDIYYFTFTENSILIMLKQWQPGVRFDKFSHRMILEEWNIESNTRLNQCEISELDLAKRIAISRYSFINHTLYLGNNRLSLILENWPKNNNNSIVILDTKTGKIINQAIHSHRFHFLSIYSRNFSELKDRYPTSYRPGSQRFFGMIDYSKADQSPQEFTISNDEATEVLSAAHPTHTLAISKIKDLKIAEPSNLEKWGAFAKRKFHRLAKNLKIFTLFLATLSVNCALAMYQRLKNLKQG